MPLFCMQSVYYVFWLYSYIFFRVSFYYCCCCHHHNVFCCSYYSRLQLSIRPTILYKLSLCKRLLVANTNILNALTFIHSCNITTVPIQHQQPWHKQQQRKTNRKQCYNAGYTCGLFNH